MKRLVYFCGSLIGLLVVLVAYLQVTLAENNFPLATSELGYIKFQQTKFSAEQLQPMLTKFSKEHNLEVYQLSTVGSSTSVDLISRGASQPERPYQISWMQFGKTGQVFPSDSVSTVPINGSYALAGRDLDIASFKTWLDSIGAVHQWEKWNALAKFLVPLFYQGIGVLVIIFVVLTASVVLAWYTRKTKSRAVRLLNGVSVAKIHVQDTKSIIVKTLFPAFIAAFCALIGLGFFKGIWLVIVRLTPNIILLFLLSYGALISFSLFISVLTRPRINEFANRKMKLNRFSAVATVIRWLVIFGVIAAIPLLASSVQYAQQQASTAKMAAELPRYYTVAFGGIFDDVNDYQAKIPSYAKLANELERQGQMVYAGVVYERESNTSGDVALLYNQKFFADLTTNNPAIKQSLKPCSFSNLLQDVQKDIKERLKSADIAGKIRCYKSSQVLIAVRNSGLFQQYSPKNTVLLVAPYVSEAIQERYLASTSTAGAAMFTDPKTVVYEANKVGLNFTTDNAADQIRLYASDQKLGSQIITGSLILSILCLFILTYVSASIYAISNAKRLFPRFLTGIKYLRLIGKMSIFDALVVVGGIGAGLIIAITTNPWTALPITLVGLILILAMFWIRYVTLRSALYNLALRKG